MANDIHLFPNKPVRTTQNGKAPASANGVRGNNDNIVALKSAEKAQHSKQNQDVTSKGSDTTKVSDAAKHMQSVVQSTKEVSGVDLKKVERIKRQLAEGSYPLDSQSIAKKMLELNALIDPPPGIQR
jgi:flagellar biosynthesis anti-sigma factor FlgM